MPGSTGISAVTGRLATDWDHTQQSIDKIIRTAIGSRIMRRQFGSELQDLIDAKLVRKNVLAVYSAVAAAIVKWEPRYRMLSGSIASASADGNLALTITGIYYPRGHLGDYTVAEDKSTRIVFGTAGR